MPRRRRNNEAEDDTSQVRIDAAGDCLYMAAHEAVVQYHPVDDYRCHDAPP